MTVPQYGLGDLVTLSEQPLSMSPPPDDAAEIKRKKAIVTTIWTSDHQWPIYRIEYNEDDGRQTTAFAVETSLTLVERRAPEQDVISSYAIRQGQTSTAKVRSDQMGLWRLIEQYGDKIDAPNPSYLFPDLRRSHDMIVRRRNPSTWTDDENEIIKILRVMIESGSNQGIIEIGA